MLKTENSSLLIIDLQTRLMPAINQEQTVLQNARRLIDAASILGVNTVFTEQNEKGLGPTVSELLTNNQTTVLHKQYFDTTREGEILSYLPTAHNLIVAGCEAHVCVLQTVLGLIQADRNIFVVEDATGARSADNKRVAINRMEAHGAEIVTTEMVLFEWLQTSEHEHFKAVLELVK